MQLHTKMLIGLGVGAGAGLATYTLTGGDAAWVSWLTTWITGPIGQIFLRLLFMLVIPLIFSALIIGVAEMGDIRSLGKVGIRTLWFTLLVSVIAVLIGLVLVNWLRPGDGFDPALLESLLADASSRAETIVGASREGASGLQILIQLVPSNVIAAAGSNDILAVMFFALFFGIGLILTPTASAERLKGAIEGILDVSMTLIDLVIRTAPVAVACLMFNLTAVFGWDLLLRLGAFVGVALLAMALHFFGVYSLLLMVFARMSPIAFFRKTQEATMMAFSTASSNASLPTTLRVAETQLELPPQIARFVLTVGASANQNGTALFEGVTVLFLAQVFGVDLTLPQQGLVMFICVLGGIGTAGIPAGSLPVIAMICAMVGVPPEGIGLILGVDRFLDMCRTTLNVQGDLVAATVVARGQPRTPAGPTDHVKAIEQTG